MTQCFDEYCSKEGIMQFTEHNLRQTKITYWLCEDHYQEKLDELHHPKPLEVEEPQYDYVEQKSDLKDFIWNHPNTSVLLLFMIIGGLFILLGWLGVY